jgi:hypothetical protein
VNLNVSINLISRRGRLWSDFKLDSQFEHQLTDLLPRASFSVPLEEMISSPPDIKTQESKLSRTFICDVVRVLSAVSFALLFSQSALSQEAAPSTRTEKTSAPKPTFTLKVAREPILNISLKAEKVKLTELANSLAKQLKIPVMVGPDLEQHLVSIEFDELTLEPAMQLLAPAVYIDYEIKTSHTESPKTLGVFLYAANQEPPVTAVVSGSTQSMLIEGDTEEGVEPTTEEERRRQEEKPLRVQFKDNLLSIRAKKQPLQLILLKVGEELGIQVDIQNEIPDVIDAELNRVSVEDAMRQLSPNITLFLRADLSNAERRALKLVLTAPQQPKSQETKAPQGAKDPAPKN